MTGAIEIKNVTKKYGSLTVLDDISMSIEAGEFVVFLGPSGCGKSTLLRMIAGLEDLNHGEISIGGNRIDTLPPGKRGVAMVFQNYALYPHMTVAQNMSFGLENLKTPKPEIETRIQAAMDVLEIAHLADRKPQQLSGGQRQRVAIGRAIVKKPQAFLFDEPLSNLDAALRGRTRLELAQLHQRLQATMVFVTHDQVEAMTLADRIVVINERKIEQIGTPVEIYHRPASKFVAKFVGAPEMNFLDVESAAETSKGTEFQLNAAGSVDTGIRRPADTTGLVLGIRAEDIQLIEDGRKGIAATVDVVEHLGDRSLVHARLSNGAEIVAVASGRSKVAASDTVQLEIDGEATHIFAEDGQAWHAGEQV
jgi:multiple sugar transport system ATP-binding protein